MARTMSKTLSVPMVMVTRTTSRAGRMLGTVTRQKVAQSENVDVVMEQIESYTEDYLERFGAYEVPRARYLELLKIALDEPTRRGRWAFELDLDEIGREPTSAA